MQSDVLIKLPVRLKVEKLLSSRYEGGQRPLSWDSRKPGNDFVQTTDGKIIKLDSDGGQSPPQKDWTILINKGDATAGYTWTLYSL